MQIKIILISTFLLLLVVSTTSAHPGSGIVVDRYGQIYFTDTGKGVWKIDTQGKLIYLPASKFHWMTMDITGSFAESPKNFGEYFERVTPPNMKPALIMCSDFPLVAGTDGNMYYAYTRSGSSNISQRSPGGKESVLASNKIFEFTNGIASGIDGSLYITESSNANANTIRKITLSGKVSTIASFTGKSSGNTPLDMVPSYCRGLAIDSTGIIYVAATGNRSILRITPNGKITTILQVENPWTPTGVAVFGGEVFILEWHDVTAENLEVRSAWIPRVRKIGRDGKVTTIATISRN